MAKQGIHPNYHEIRVVCACGNTFTTRSTHKGDIHLEICSNCHPLFTGKQKLVDTAGRVERFRREYAKAETSVKQTERRVHKTQEPPLAGGFAMQKHWGTPRAHTGPPGVRVPASVQI